MNPLLLDLFCGAGGAAMGYHRAGFRVVGVDIAPQPRYPFQFVQMDALEFARAYGSRFDVIHASPPCQFYSRATPRPHQHPDLIAATREVVSLLGVSYVIENVPDAAGELINPLMLCGTMFGLLTTRHRFFETEPVIWWPPAPCSHQRATVKMGRRPDPERHYINPVGHFTGMAFAQKALGIDWMRQAELAQAIPPAYTEFIGKQLIRSI